MNEVYATLLQHSANPNLQSNSGCTALMLAAGRGLRRACRPSCDPRPTPSCSMKTAAPPCSGPRLRATRPPWSSSGSTQRHRSLTPPRLCRPTGRWRASRELSRFAARRDLQLGGAGRAAEGGQVAAQGRAGQCALLWYNWKGSASFLRPAARARHTACYTCCTAPLFVVVKHRREYKRGCTRTGRRRERGDIYIYYNLDDK